MLRCIELAKLGLGNTASNPMVGSILVYNDKIIGEGYHAKFGEAHAEVNCLNSVSKENRKYISKATLYVTLEPCNHKGKTPPCTRAILEANIKKVVVGTIDLNPEVDNKGIKALKEKGVEVVTGICKKECYKLNKVFFTNHAQQRSYIKLKWTQSLNGIIGNKLKQLAISNEQSNIINHKYRTRVDAILVGYNTALLDKPSLNARNWQGKQPSRIFIDWDGSLPHTIIYKKGYNNIVLTTKAIESTTEVTYLKVEKKAKSIAETLYQNNIYSVLIEGGAETLQFFINENSWDEAIVITNNNEVDTTNSVKAPKLTSSTPIHENNILDDTIKQFSNSPFLT